MAEPNYDRLVALLPELEARIPLWGAVYEVAHEDGIVLVGFDWSAWSDEAQRFVEPGGVEAADLETCRRLITLLVRAERFCEGSLRGAIVDGLVARIVRRISELTRSEVKP